MLQFPCTFGLCGGTVIGLIIVIDPLLIKCLQDSWKGIPTRLNTCPYTREMRSYFYRDVCEATQEAVEDGHHKLRVCSCISEFFHFNFLLICLLRLNLFMLPLPKTDFVPLQSSQLEKSLEILWSQMGKYTVECFVLLPLWMKEMNLYISFFHS